jgi:hypothetical protein
MSVFAWIVEWVPSKHRAQWLYRRGMLRAKLKKFQAANADYSAVIELENAPADLRAMALFNRALVSYAAGAESDAVRDLDEVLAMVDIGENVKTEARRKLIRMERSSEREETPTPNANSLPQGSSHAR